MHHNGKKICVLLLVLCMLIGTMPVGARATEAETYFVGQQLYLGDDLTMRFHAVIGAEHSANGIMNVTVGENTTPYSIQDMTAEEDGSYVFPVELSAAQMTENITLTLVCGEETVLQKTYSVQEYAHTLLEGKYTNETKALVRQLLNYGAKAQLYFGHKTDDLANAGYELDAQPAVSAEVPAYEVSDSLESINYYANSMVFRSKIAVRYYFDAPNGIEGYTFTANGETCKPEEKNGYYYIEVAGIGPQSMSKALEISVTDGAGTLSFSTSPMHYVVRMYNKETTNQALKELLAAATGYFAAAEKFDGLTDGDISLKANSGHVYPLNEEPYIHFQAQTTLTATDVREGVYPRVGLRLTNEAGATVDFVLGYANTQKFWADGFYVVTTDAQGVEATPEWIGLPAGTLPDDDDVVISVRKEFETTTLYIGEQQALQTKLAGFGADSAVTVSLYSRYTDTRFTDYGVEKIEMPDSSLNAGNHNYVINEVPYDNMTAHTELSVSEVMNEVYARVGLRLTNEAGQTLDYVLAYNKDMTFWANGFYFVTTNAEGKEVTQWINTAEGVLTEDDNVSLQIKVLRGKLYFYMNGTLVHSGTFENFPLTGGVTASLYSKHTTTDFSNYNATEVDPAASETDDGNHTYQISDAAYDNFTAQTNLTVSEVKNGVAARVGLRLVNEAGQTLDYVLAYKNDQALWENWLLIVTKNAEGKEVTEWIELSAGSLTDDDNVTLKVRKVLGTLQFYLNGTHVKTKAYAGFAAENTVTASLYSKNTATDFAGYNAEYISAEDSIVEAGSHVFAIGDAAYDNFAAQTELTVSGVKNGVAARVGLRLTNEAGQTLDYVLAYKNTQALWNDYLLIVTWDAEGKEVLEWIELPEGTLTSDDNVTLKVRKTLGTLQFYLNGTLVHTKAYAGFAAENTGTASLYSKNAVSDFAGYSAEHVSAEDAIVEDGSHAVTIGDTAYESFTAQTGLTVSEVLNGVYARTGLRLTNEAGQILDYVLAYNNNGSFWADGFYIVTWNEEGKDTAQWVSLESGMLPDAENVTLKVEKIGGTLNFYLDGILVKSGTYEGFGVANKATASLYSRHTATDFVDYSTEVLHPEDSNMETGTHLYAISSAASASLTAQTDLTVSEVLNGYYARVGLRLTNESGQALDYVLAYNKNTSFWANGFYIVTWDAAGNEKTKWIDVATGIVPDDDDVTMKAQLLDGKLHLYIGETEVFSDTVDNFATDVAATAALYSKYTTTDFSNYSAN